MKLYAAIAAVLVSALIIISTLSFFSTNELITLTILAALLWAACLTSHLDKGRRLKAGKAGDGGADGPQWLPSGKRTRHKDPHFGVIYTTENEGEHCLCLSSVLAIAAHDSCTAFTGHLASLLASLPNRTVVLAGETSHPNIAPLLDKLPRASIERIVIRARTDMNAHVKATLECTLHTTYGTVHIRPQWNAWQPVREMEIMTTLLAPLVAKALLGRLIFEEEGTEKPLPANFNEIVKATLRLAGYPYQRKPGANDERMTDYVRILMRAQASQSDGILEAALVDGNSTTKASAF
ncbi:hypothetical protein [Stutzerimonas stutzeri]|uniref:hypothetical protein n=1 Tax=Stutzerimonas stutzeri TaxID=316 RepID=UPI00265CE7D4|nr:hypothetical protein [Stutzerimonas stutzeri]MCF6783749.1 hypothetical protein [Stutzerimonas stutzeri]